MIFKLPYKVLMEKLEYVSTVVEDTMLDENIKNIIFKLTKDRATLVGYNPRAVCRTEIDTTDFEIELDDSELDKNGVKYFQLKAKELNTFLKTFNGLRLTKAETCTFETFNNKIRLIVLEVPKNEEQGYLEQTSRWIFDVLPVKDYVISEINMTVEEDKMACVSSADVLLYVQSLIPLLNNSGGDNLPSRLHFGDYVFTVSQFATLFENALPDAFRGIVLTYPSVSFLKKILENNEVIEVSKTETHLAIIIGSSIAFLRYIVKMPDQSLYVNSFKRDHAVVIDRQYFKDVLKRFMLINEQIIFEVKPEENVLTMSNSKSIQDIPLLQTKGMAELSNVKFKLAWQILGKAIIGDDEIFSENLFVYILPNPKSGYTLIFSDNSGKWFSLIQVR